jgi:hypothetical protein
MAERESSDPIELLEALLLLRRGRGALALVTSRTLHAGTEIARELRTRLSCEAVDLSAGGLPLAPSPGLSVRRLLMGFPFLPIVERRRILIELN